MTEIAKGNVNDFTVSLHGHKHTFQALSKAERDGWLVAIEPKMTDAKTSREGIVGSEGYKSQLEKYGVCIALFLELKAVIVAHFVFRQACSSSSWHYWHLSFIVQTKEG